MRRRVYRLQRGGTRVGRKQKKKKFFEIKTPNRHDIPLYKDISKLRKKYGRYKKRKKQRTQQKGGFGLGPFGLLASLGGALAS